MYKSIKAHRVLLPYVVCLTIIAKNDQTLSTYPLTLTKTAVGEKMRVIVVLAVDAAHLLSEI